MLEGNGQLNGQIIARTMRWRTRPGVFERVPLGVTWTALAAWVCGITAPVIIGIVGEIFVGELLLIQLAVLIVLRNGTQSLPRSRLFMLLLQLLVLMLAGYMLADIYRDARPAQFLRGWARIILLVFDVASLTLVALHDRRNLWWFVLGLAIGTLGDMAVREMPIDSPTSWKLGYGLAIVLMAACCSHLLPVRIAAILFALLGSGNIVMDFRILGAICIVLAGILWIRALPSEIGRAHV